MLDKIKEVKEARNALHCLNLEAPGAVVDNVIMKVEAAFRAIQAQQGDPADEAICATCCGLNRHPMDENSPCPKCGK